VSALVLPLAPPSKGNTSAASARVRVWKAAAEHEAIAVRRDGVAWPAFQHACWRVFEAYDQIMDILGGSVIIASTGRRLPTGEVMLYEQRTAKWIREFFHWHESVIAVAEGARRARSARLPPLDVKWSIASTAANTNGGG